MEYASYFFSREFGAGGTAAKKGGKFPVAIGAGCRADNAKPPKPPRIFRKRS
jgi:hypothetical protein